jgi:outer membrane protein assembly factor BamB
MLLAAYGAVWAVDAETGRLLRVDPRDGKVRARIAMGGFVVVNRGAGSVWAARANEVLRIDPASSRVTARIRVPGLRAGDIVPAGGAMWLIEAGGVTRIDPARNAAGRPIGTSQGGFQNVGANTDGRTLYVMRGDGRLLGFDARTGKRLSSVHAAITGFPGAVADGSVILEGDSGVIAIDPRTGRATWSRDLGAQRVNNSVLAGDALWVQATDRATHRDRLWRLDAKTGQVTGSLVLPEFGAAGMAAVGSRIWVVSLSGELVVVQ